MASKRKTVKAKTVKVPSVKRIEYHVKVARSCVETYTVFATSAEEANDLVRSGEGHIYEVEQENSEILEDETLPF